jgi:hypothetical protein
LRADLYADGYATVIIKARNGAIKRKKICAVELRRIDPQFGDYASGDCERI